MNIVHAHQHGLIRNFQESLPLFYYNHWKIVLVSNCCYNKVIYDQHVLVQQLKVGNRYETFFKFKEIPKACGKIVFQHRSWRDFEKPCFRCNGKYLEGNEPNHAHYITLLPFGDCWYDRSLCDRGGQILSLTFSYVHC